MELISKISFKLKVDANKVEAKAKLLHILSNDLVKTKPRRDAIIVKGFVGLENMSDDDLADLLNYCGLVSYIDIKEWESK